MSDEEKEEMANEGSKQGQQPDQAGEGESGGGREKEEQKDGDQQLSDAEGSLTRQEPPPTLLEWSVRVVTLLVLVGLAGYLVWTGLQPTRPPQFELEIKWAEVTQRDGAWVVPLDVTNRGTEAVRDLVVRVALQTAAGDIVEEASTTFSLVGQNERQTAAFRFDADPRAHDAVTEVTGYQLP